MPKFLDHHATIPMPLEMAQGLAERIKAGKPDEQFGTVVQNVFVGETETWCLAEAPNADAIRKAHESIGINLGPDDVVEVQPVV